MILWTVKTPSKTINVSMKAHSSLFTNHTCPNTNRPLMNSFTTCKQRHHFIEQLVPHTDQNSVSEIGAKVFLLFVVGHSRRNQTVGSRAKSASKTKTEKQLFYTYTCSDNQEISHLILSKYPHKPFLNLLFSCEFTSFAYPFAHDSLAILI